LRFASAFAIVQAALGSLIQHAKRRIFKDMNFQCTENERNFRLSAVVAFFFIVWSVGTGIGQEKPEIARDAKIPHLDQIGSIEKTINPEKEDLFQRRPKLPMLFSFERIREEIRGLRGSLTPLFSKNFWAKETLGLVNLNGFFLVSFLLAFGIIMLLILRCQRLCKRLGDHPAIAPHLSRAFAFELIYGSLPLLGMAAFLDIYFTVRSPDPSVPIIQVVVSILWVLLITNWYLMLLNLLDQANEDSIFRRLSPHFRTLLLIIRYVAVSHLSIAWLIGESSTILLLLRVLFELSLLLWLYRFSKKIKKSSVSKSITVSRVKSIFQSIGLFFGYLIAGGALMLDLTGYGSLAVYWLSSWLLSSVVFLWGGVSFFILQEWHSNSRQLSEIKEEGDKITGNPFRWLIICLCWLAWFGTVISIIIIAWGGRQTIIIGFFRALNHPFAVGNMQFRLSGFIYAFLILVFTHAVVKLWHRFFQNKVLAYSGLDFGIQESIATISVYIFWGLGILVAFHAFGLNTTSLTVALGALGIGLGFGLQNIFNNFISGIILLFERPIQVGDVLEIKDTWATVKKINVRSTVVQTWDNASLIIPNSEFISTQVTNWSFKDMRLRRNIDVGVAYGSNTELVRETLLEIAGTMPNVMKNPKPDVLFRDFGDSALIFRLRVWTVVDHMVTVETNIRFEIDRLFRERGITIAFPQRDIHLRSIPDETSTEKKIPEHTKRFKNTNTT
jgi:small-conductance mechanosensitive channel